MNVIMYSTHCPRCNVLKTKLDNNNIKYTVITDIDQMEKIGIMSVPVLSVDGELLDFSQSIKWINSIANVRD